MAQTESWKKFGLDNTQLYFFRLPDGASHQSLTAAVVNQKIQQLPTKMYFNGKPIERKNEFIYLAKKTNVLYGQKLPFYLPANVWVFAFNYNDAYLLIDDALKIKIYPKNKFNSSKWQLPETFDMSSDLTLSLKQYATIAENELTARYIPYLSLQHKNIVKTFGDTTLVYNLKKLPLGIKTICKGINNESFAVQEYVVENAILFKNELFFYIPNLEKDSFKINPMDLCYGKMTDIAGHIGYAGGCITGNGSGKCQGILSSTQSKKYRVTLIIEPPISNCEDDH